MKSVRAQAGVALAIVVWFIAGMSLLVAGIVSQASVDVRMAQLHVARAKVSAAGDGAVQLLLADLLAGKLPVGVWHDRQAGEYRLGELDVAVTLVPTAGLINLNTASARLLAALFVVAGGADQSQAEFLADNVINWRKPLAGRGITRGASARFNEVEDLLRVDGVSRSLLDGVRDYVVAGSLARGGMDWAQAPQQVVAVLEKADARQHAALTRRKARLAQAAPAGDQAPNFSGGAFRADAVVRYGDRTWLRRRWVHMEAGGATLLPWRMVRTEPPRVIAR